MIFSLIGTAHAASPKGDGGGAFPPFDASTFPAQIFWFVLVFGALYLLMSKIALPRIADTMARREDKIEGDLKAASSMQEKARAAGEAYEKLLADARSNAQSIGQKAKDEAGAASDARRKSVETELSQKIAASEARINSARDKAMGNVAAIATDAAADIVARITGVAPKADDVKKAVSAIKGS
jgi:F-type H+-transporting ATPase subunit b